METTPNYLSQVDFDRVLDAIPSLNIRKWEDEDIQYLMKILYHLALRPIEGIMLKKSDFDIKNRRCHLGKTKTQKHSSAVIPRVFVDELAMYLDFKDPGRLFPELTYHTFWVWVTKLGEQLEIEPWQNGNRLKTHENTKGHIFRKSWGKDMLEKGVTINIISTHLRHSKIAMTYDYYLKTNEKAVMDTI